ncbi:hypothetical protein R1flu_015134 [Riccia fluitans]|uniref:Uncharacterized protein n=1 Tax=Riccia fluitans TaxID=41844 RepID=A0ABD1YIC9_9MARC
MITKEKTKMKLGASPTYQQRHSENIDGWLGKDFIPVIQALGEAGPKLIPKHGGRWGCYKVLIDSVLKRAETDTTISDMLRDESRELWKAKARIAELENSASTSNEGGSSATSIEVAELTRPRRAFREGSTRRRPQRRSGRMPSTCPKAEKWRRREREIEQM